MIFTNLLKNLIFACLFVHASGLTVFGHRVSVASFPRHSLAANAGQPVLQQER